MKVISNGVLPKQPVAFQGRHGIGVQWPFIGPQATDPFSPTSTWAEVPYAEPNPSDFTVHCSADKLNEFRLNGFDHIRLGVHPGPWMEALGIGQERLDYLFGMLDTAIDSVIASGLGVITDMHPTNYLIPAYYPTSCLDGAAQFALYDQVIGLFAQRYRNRAQNRLALSLFNEPPAPNSFAGNWSTMQQQLYATARRWMSAHTLILTSTNYAHIDDLVATDPRGFNSNTLFDIHPYIPALAAIQGYTPSSYNRYVYGLNYPAGAEGQTKSSVIAAMTASVNADESLDAQQKLDTIAAQTQEIGFYFDVPLDRNWMNFELSKVDTWCSTYGIPRSRIICAEYGATRDNDEFTGMPYTSRLRYYADMAGVIKLHGFRRTVFSADAKDYGITLASGDTIGQLDPAFMNAIY